MTSTDLTEAASEVAAKIAQSTGQARLDLQPQLIRVMDQYRTHGVCVPRRLQRLENQLIEEAIEARFDNMPI